MLTLQLSDMQQTFPIFELHPVQFALIVFCQSKSSTV